MYLTWTCACTWPTNHVAPAGTYMSGTCMHAYVCRHVDAGNIFPGMLGLATFAPTPHVPFFYFFRRGFPRVIFWRSFNPPRAPPHPEQATKEKGDSLTRLLMWFASNLSWQPFQKLSATPLGGFQTCVCTIQAGQKYCIGNQLFEQVCIGRLCVISVGTNRYG